jgi:hypothetical protein
LLLSRVGVTAVAVDRLNADAKMKIPASAIFLSMMVSPCVGGWVVVVPEVSVGNEKVVGVPT